MLLAAAAEQAYIRAILGALGATDAEAHAVAEALGEADLRGYPSHGLLRVPETVAHLRRGTLRAGARPRVARARGGAVLMDGDAALGAYAGACAVREVVTRARTTGSAAVALYNCGHIAMAGYYVEQAARADLIGLLVTKGNPAVHPHAGMRPMFGTNPISIAVPTAGDPFLLDMATSAISMGTLRVAEAEGRPAPPDVAVDRAGRPTTNPRAALAGAISPVGGAKGYGLGLAIELLAGALPGVALGAGRPGGPGSKWGTLVLAIDPAVFLDPATFKEQASAYLATVKASAHAPGVAEILVPGERAFRTRRERLTAGVPIADAVWDEVAVVARSLGVDPAAYAARPLDSTS